MKSKNTIYTTMSQKTLKPQQTWASDFKQQLQSLKRPFLNRVEYSKLRIESRIEDFKSEKEACVKYEGIIQCLIEKLLQNKLPPVNQQSQHTQQSESSESSSEKEFLQNKEDRNRFEDDSDQQKQNEHPVDSYFAEWPGRDKHRIFKNTSNVLQQYDRVFNKKIGVLTTKKPCTYSYRTQQKLMLQRIYQQLKDPSTPYIPFPSITTFLTTHPLILTIYGITPTQLQDLISCSAHHYPDRLTKQEFFQLFLVNSQTRGFDQMEGRTQRVCCLGEEGWKEVKRVFDQVDTFGRGEVGTGELVHKMGTVGVGKELLEANTIYFTNINRYYTFSKVLFDLQHKSHLPATLTWLSLQSLITNFTHITQPTLDEVFQNQIKTATIHDSTNTFLLKDDTLRLLKEEFRRCPKFSEHFVKCRYFCEELLAMEEVARRAREVVRGGESGSGGKKGFVGLVDNIRLMQGSGVEYFDMDQMLTYFSVKGFQTKEGKLEALKDSFDSNSTTSEEEFEQRKRQQRRAKRMKSLDHMDKIMRSPASDTKFQPNPNKKATFKPVQIEEFNLTKPRTQPTIRERRVKQMLEQKQRALQQQLQPFVTANPTPSSLSCQRYQDQQNKQEIRKQIERERRQKEREKDEMKIKQLMANTKLFERRDLGEGERRRREVVGAEDKKEFEARPISWFVKERNLLGVIQGEKEERRKNRIKETKEKYVFGYWKDMPYEGGSNFKRLTIAQAIDKNRSNDSLELQIREINDSLINTEQTTKAKTTIVPDFAKLQKQFMEELESKKKMRSPTVVKEFKLSVSKRRQSQVVVEEERRPSTPKRLVQSNPQNKETNQQPAIVGTTKKFQCMLELTQQKIAQKKYEAELEKFEEKERRKKEKIFARFMKSALEKENKKHHKSGSQKSTRRRASKEQSTSRIEHQHEQELKKIYQRVLTRPFLFQTATSSQSQQPTIRKKGRKSSHPHKASQRQQPQRVRIPADPENHHGYPTIPPLNYIQEEDDQEEYDDENEYEGYDQEGNYVVRDFSGESWEGKEEEEGQGEMQRGERRGLQQVSSSKLNRSF